MEAHACIPRRTTRRVRPVKREPSFRGAPLASSSRRSVSLLGGGTDRAAAAGRSGPCSSIVAAMRGSGGRSKAPKAKACMRNAAVATAKMRTMKTRLAMGQVRRSIKISRRHEGALQGYNSNAPFDLPCRIRCSTDTYATTSYQFLKLLGVIAAAHRDDRFRKVHDLGPRAPAKGSLRTVHPTAA